MRYEIFNGTRRTYAYRSGGGLEEVAPNKTATLDVFIADGVKALQQARGVVFRPVTGDAPAQAGKPAGEPQGGPDDDMKALRAEYRELAGKNPGPKWDEAKLRHMIAERKG